jgi:hypothetical protein
LFFLGCREAPDILNFATCGRLVTQADAGSDEREALEQEFYGAAADAAKTAMRRRSNASYARNRQRNQKTDNNDE